MKEEKITESSTDMSKTKEEYTEITFVNRSNAVDRIKTEEEKTNEPHGVVKTTTCKYPAEPTMDSIKTEEEKTNEPHGFVKTTTYKYPAELTLSEKLAQLKQKMKEDGSLDAMCSAGQNITHETLDVIARKARESQRCFACQACAAQFHFGGCKECEVIYYILYL